MQFHQKTSKLKAPWPKYVLKVFFKSQIVLQGTLRVSPCQKNDGFSQLSHKNLIKDTYMVYVVIFKKRVKIEGFLTKKYVVKKFLKPQIVL